jgi:hypothetical protein
MSSSQTLSRDAASSAARYACAVLVLTSIHHAYGAYVYNTPWRYHAVLVAGVTAALIFGALAVVRSRPSGLLRALAQGLFILATLGVAVLMIGMFEGLYNHVVKNLLYFGGASSALMTRLFPPPTYELPNDAFFEITGILQVVPAALAAWYLYQTTQRRRAAHTPRSRPGRSSRAVPSRASEERPSPSRSQIGWCTGSSGALRRLGRRRLKSQQLRWILLEHEVQLALREALGT